MVFLFHFNTTNTRTPLTRVQLLLAPVNKEQGIIKSYPKAKGARKRTLATHPLALPANTSFEIAENVDLHGHESTARSF